MEFRGCSWLNECSANLFQLSSSAYYDRLPFRKLIQQIFVYDDVAQGHTPFSSLDLVRHELKRMNKRMNCEIFYGKQASYAYLMKRTSYAPPSVFTFAFSLDMTASASGTAIKAARLMGLQNPKRGVQDLYIL